MKEETKKKIEKITKKINMSLKFFYLYLSIVGIFGFSCFILEESLQQLTFANFQCKSSGRYDLLKLNIEKMAEINGHLRLTNKVLIGLQPFQWLAYADYVKATEAYIKTTRATVLAKDPGLYVGEEMGDLLFYYKGVSRSESRGTVLRAGCLSYRLEGETIPGSPLWIRDARIERVDGRRFVLSGRIGKD